jgi:hypothetical protein
MVNMSGKASNMYKKQYSNGNMQAEQEWQVQ